MKTIALIVFIGIVIAAVATAGFGPLGLAGSIVMMFILYALRDFILEDS